MASSGCASSSSAPQCRISARPRNQRLTLELAFRRPRPPRSDSRIIGLVDAQVCLEFLSTCSPLETNMPLQVSGVVTEFGGELWRARDPGREYRRRPTRFISPVSFAARRSSNRARRTGIATSLSGRSRARSVNGRWPVWDDTSRPRPGGRQKRGQRSSRRIAAASASIRHGHE
jgi:hypothetical protein